MTMLRRLAFLALLSTWMAVPSCAGPFDTCVKPYASQISISATATEIGDIVGVFLSCDPTFNTGEAPACAVASLEVLAAQLGADGKTIVDCLVTYYETNGTAKQQAAAHAVAVKRGIHASLRCPTLDKLSLRGGPSDGQEPHKLFQRGSTPRPATFDVAAQ